MLIQRDYAHPNRLREHVAQIVNSLHLYKEQGIEQGIFRERINVVLNAHANGLDLSTIQLITGEPSRESRRF